MGEGEELEQSVPDKYNLGAADLEKVNAHQEERDDASGMGMANLGKLADSSPQQKIVHVKPEDLKMIMEEFELPKGRVESALIEHDGNVMATIRSLMRL